MHGKSVRWLVLGASYMAVSLSVVGYMDYVHEGPGKTTKVYYAKPTPKPQPSGHGIVSPGVTGTTGPIGTLGGTINGDWKCADATQCNDTIKSITGDNKMTTESTVADAKTQSVCHIVETSDLKATEEGHTSTYDTDITPHSVSVIDSNDNTDNCSDVYKEPLDSEAHIKLIPSVVQTTKHLSIDGVPYVQALQTEIKAIQTSHAKTPSPKLAPWGGNWTDTGNDITLVFSQDQKTITKTFTESFDSNVKCKVTEKEQVKEVDPGSPSKNELTVYVLPGTLVYDDNGADNDACDAAVESYNGTHSSTNPITHVLIFDGTGFFKLTGKSFLRSR